MQRIIGPLYIATGLLCDFVMILLTGAMLGMATPIYTLSGLFMPAIFSTGPALLVLTGVTTMTGGTRRGVECLITSLAVVAGLALWTIPRIGWRQSAWLFLEPEAGSYLIGSLILLAIRKRWITALIGVVISAPFFVFGTGYLIYALLFGKAVLSLTEIWIVVPTIMLMLSFLSAVRVRFA